MSFFLILMLLPHAIIASLAAQQPASRARGFALNGRAPNASSALLDVIQVTAPVLKNPKSRCEQTLMVHTFGWSYGMPFLGDYSPPNCDFNRVTFNFTVTSAGRQYDRLALMFFNDTEIWRTSTAEPTQGGIVWTYIKDMSHYLALFKNPQKIIFDLGNLVDDTYTGSFNTTLTATFFIADDTDPADVIIPVSSGKSSSNNPSAFVVPDQKAISTLLLPQNVKKAVFSISACGQGAEEFWWSNVLTSDTNVFGNQTTLYGYSPFRELQLYIDGGLAGVAWPFPIIFTGGVVPGFWRPVVGIDAFDLREDEIDISPFLPVLCDGKEHTFEIRVAGIADDGEGHGTLTETVGSNWIVTGKVFLWLDPSGEITTGSVPKLELPEPSLALLSSRKSSNGTVSSLDYSVKAMRSLLISSTVKTSSGTQVVTWRQNLTFSNDGTFTNGGNDQVNRQATSGIDLSSDQYSKAFSYPLSVFSTYEVLAGGNYTIKGEMTRGKNVRKIGDLAFPSELETFDFSHRPGQHASSFTGAASKDWQNGTATYLAVPAQKRSYGSGRTEQYYSLSGIGDAVAMVQSPDEEFSNHVGKELYHRHVVASNDSIILDEEDFDGRPVYSRHAAQQPAKQIFARLGIKAMLGRGPL
ncbi:peptide N-acetyl-beta-D-glucosaminyl asparaginase amidase A-domain-containing protein [Clohesyomyces aquaticus]|uniref:Peptide N-acetyl-beta-D-glucosaminyl asparaginase amidase A-domain-containing protein n=1 Tax=Clohesyomyces aquaticus TaxID=1231657 RepID=A0A1Y1ZKZ5_9PLEO|nr:peptide N-acetyl-beta-D-glucosaminyl asparaginase amidase A-domain-containing protein [Clohesyomyces aquaticus]